MTNHELLTSAIDFGAIGSGFTTAIYYGLGVVAVALVAYFVWRMLRFNVRVTIHRFTSGGYRRVRVWGRENTDKSGKVLGFEIKGYPKYDGRKIPEEYFGEEVFGFGKNKTRKVVDLRYTRDGNLVPIALPSSAEPVWEALSNPEIHMYNLAHEGVEQRFDVRSFWDKHGSMVMQLGVLMIVVVIVIIFQDNLSNLISTSASASNVCTESLMTCREICSNAQSLAEGTGGLV